MLPLTKKEKKTGEQKLEKKKKEFGDDNEKKHCKVQDHCHYLSKFGGATHSTAT